MINSNQINMFVDDICNKAIEEGKGAVLTDRKLKKYLGVKDDLKKSSDLVRDYVARLKRDNEATGINLRPTIKILKVLFKNKLARIEKEIEKNFRKGESIKKKYEAELGKKDRIIADKDRYIVSILNDLNDCKSKMEKSEADSKIDRKSLSLLTAERGKWLRKLKRAGLD